MTAVYYWQIMAQQTATTTNQKLSVTGLIGLARQRWRKAGYTLSSTEERLAVDQYAWPLPLRVAGYFTMLSAFAISVSAIVQASPLGVVTAISLWALFALAFSLFVSAKPVRFGHRLKLFLAQVIAATALLYVTYCGGPEFLYYMLAAEIQFLLPFRSSIYATVGLCAVLMVNIVLAAPASYHSQLTQFLLEAPTGFVFVAAFTRIAVTELIQRRRSTLLLEELNEAHAQLQRYTDRVEDLAVARERNRMAREIHDTLGHYLTVINIQIETAQKLKDRDPERSQASLAMAKQLATECLNEVRRSVSALRPAALDDISLSDALTQLVDEMRRSTDAEMHLEMQGEGILQPSVEVTVYRAIQEALTNVRKHAGARNVWVRMHWNQEELVATVRDDGRGARPERDAREHILDPVPNGTNGMSAGPSFGLHGMRERLARVGGALVVETAPGKGFDVTLAVPHPTDSGPSAEEVEPA